MLLLLVAAIAVAVFFTPTIVATSRSHRNMLAIVVLNIMLGWTFLGWVGALVWACTDNVRA